MLMQERGAVMRPATFAGFGDAYVAVLGEVLSRTEYENAPRGNPSLECLDVAFRLADPRRRLPVLAGRTVNVVFHLAETLWYLSGRDDLAMPAYYAPRMAAYSADGVTMTGTAYGPPLREQWDRVLELLVADPDSKRAVITFFRPAELAVPNNPDVSCAIAVQFLLREGRLHMSVVMRGNDAYRGMVGDVFAFTFIQEFMAARLGVRLGTYAHHAASMHVNLADLPAARRALDGEPRHVALPSMPAMPPDASWADVQTVCEQEEALRTGATKHTVETIDALDLDPYWRQLILVFEVYRQIKHETDRPVDAATLAGLDPAYRRPIVGRWPRRMPELPR